MIRIDITDQWETLRSDPAALQRYILDVYGADRAEPYLFPNTALIAVNGERLGLVCTYGYPRITPEGGRVYLELADLVVSIGVPDGSAYREPLAALAHEQWSGWMRWVFEKSRRNFGGSVTIPRKLVERWTRQMHTAYANLPENEKASDRVEADKVLELLRGKLRGALPVPPDITEWMKDVLDDG